MKNEEFNKEQVVEKVAKRSTFRIFGIVIPDMNHKDTILGYAILDLAKYKTKLYSTEQTKALIERYTFENAKVENGVIENTECKMDRLLLFNMQKQVIGNKGITILGEVSNSKGSGFRVINYDGVVTDVLETKLIDEISKGIPVINAKVMPKTSKKEAYISAIKGTFPKLTKAEVDKLKKKESPAQTDENKKVYLEKIKRRFKYSIIDHCSFDNWMVSDKLPTGEKPGKHFTKFKNALSRYVEEYAKVKHPSVVEKAKSFYTAEEDYVANLAIVKACTFIDAFENKGLKRPFMGFSRDFTNFQLLTVGFVEFAKSLNNTKLTALLSILEIEESNFKEAKIRTRGKKDVYLTKVQNGRVLSYSPYANMIVKDYHNDVKEGKTKETSSTLALLDILNNIKDSALLHYIHLLPMVHELIKVKNEVERKEAVPVINLQFTNTKGINEIGFCLKSDEEGEPCNSKLYSKGKLRYVFADLDLTVAEKNNIIKRATCFGDFAFAAKLLKLRENGYDEIENTAYMYRVNTSHTEQVEIMKEAIMIILAVYNLDLAKYLNKEYSFVDLDLDEIGHEQFILSSEDKIFYQSGGKFNVPTIQKSQSWCGLSRMPGGLRSAVALCSTKEISDKADDLLDYLYIK